jgi:hypothetical protein
MRGKYVQACTSDAIDAKKSLERRGPEATMASALARLRASARRHDTLFYTRTIV